MTAGKTLHALALIPIPGAVLPLLVPGAVAAVVLSLAAGDRLGRWLDVRRATATALLLSFGLILAGTLTPQWEAIANGARGTGTCDLSRLGPPSLEDLAKFYDAGLNILIFIPLGATIALAPRSRRKALLLACAIALPVAIETIQMLVPALDRTCESADVVDNLIGLGGGLAAGTIVGRLVPATHRRA